MRTYIKEVQETNELPKSKRKRTAIGMITVLSIFGISVLGSTLSAVAKDTVPTNSPGTCVKPSSAKPTSDTLIEGMSGAAGSFVIGGVCGLIVVIGILKAQGK